MFDALTRSADAYDRAEGFWGLEQWDQANEQFRLATRARRQQALYKVRWGMLLHERFNDFDAADLFHEALEKDPANAEAYIGLAIISADSFDGKRRRYRSQGHRARSKIRRSARAARRSRAHNDDRAAAVAEADKAIALEDDALDAMAIHAAVELIADRPPDAWFAKISASIPPTAKPTHA